MNYNTSNAKIASRKENFKCLLMKKLKNLIKYE